MVKGDYNCVHNNINSYILRVREREREREKREKRERRAHESESEFLHACLL